jgi:hypothetical protein
MGFLTRALVPRSVRRATHPVRAVRRAATPRSVKQAGRVLHPVSSAAYDIERSLNTKPRKRKAATKAPVAPVAPVAPEVQDRDLHRGRVMAAWLIAAIVVLFVVLCLVWGFWPVIATIIVGTFVIAKAVG